MKYSTACGCFFVAGTIMMLDGVITYFGWDFPTYAVAGMGFMLGSFSLKFFSDS